MSKINYLKIEANRGAIDFITNYHSSASSTTRDSVWKGTVENTVKILFAIQNKQFQVEYLKYLIVHCNFDALGPPAKILTS